MIPTGQNELVLTRQAFALKAADAMTADFTGMALHVRVSDSSSLTSDSLSSAIDNPTASITLPSEVVANVNSSTARIVFQTFLQDSFYQSRDSISSTESELNSIILSADVFSSGSDVTVRGLANPVTLQFTKMRTLVSSVVDDE